MSKLTEALGQDIERVRAALKELSDKIWLVTFMHYDLGFFDHETCRLEPVGNPFEPKVLPMSPAPCARIVVASFEVGSLRGEN